MSDKKIDDAVKYLYTHGQLYAEAKAHRVHIEEFRKSQKALLMKAAIAEKKASSSAAAEMEAYAHPTYIALLEGLKAATEREEGFRWGLISAQARIEVWRSTEASNRVMDRAVM